MEWRMVLGRRALESSAFESRAFEEDYLISDVGFGGGCEIYSKSEDWREI